MTEKRSTHWRTLWISDLHLGTTDCKAESLLDFLDRNESETLYLVGNTIDGTQLRRHRHWPQAHNDVVQRILHKARHGTRVILLPGNCDTFARDFIGYSFGDIEVLDEDIHEMADGRRLLVVHGASQDELTLQAKWLSPVANVYLETARWLRQYIDRIPLLEGLHRALFPTKGQQTAKPSASTIDHYALTMTDEARKRGLDGVVCGHIHHSQIRDLNGTLYCNDGDWVTSLSALAENHEGRLELLNGCPHPSRSKGEIAQPRHHRPLSLPALPSAIRRQNKYP